MTLDEWLKLAQILVTLGVVLIGAWVRTALGRITDRIERVEVRIKASEQATKVNAKAISENAKAIHDGVKREDWIRESSRSRQTMERLVEGQARLEGRLDLGERIAASAERIATHMERIEEEAPRG